MTRARRRFVLAFLIGCAGDPDGEPAADVAASDSVLADVAEGDSAEGPPDAAPGLDSVPATDTPANEDAADTASPEDPATIPLRGPCPLAERLGGFLVEAQSEYSIIDGKVADGVNPVAVLTEEQALGPCRLWRRRAPICAAPCGPGTVCAPGDTCVPFPKGQDLGEVAIDGLEKVIRLTAQQPGNTYFDTDLPHPIFIPSSVVRLATPGGDVGAIALAGVGIEPLEVPGETWVLEAGAPIAVSWTAPTAAVVRSTVALEVNIDQHGTSPLFLRCDLEDTGAAELPASLIDALIADGVSGFPSGKLTRRTADHQAVTGGCVDLLVGSPRKVDVRVAGFTPCKKDSDCPAAETCNLATEICSG